MSTHSRRSKRTLAWKLTRARAKSPRTRKAMGVFIRRSIQESIGPLVGAPDASGTRAAVARACHEFLGTLGREPLREIQVVGSAIDIEGGRLTTTVLVPAWLAIKAKLPTETTP